MPAVPRARLSWPEKILRTEDGKVWRDYVAFLFDLTHYFTMNAKQDKMFVLTVMLYCTTKSYKTQVAKLATKRQF